MYDESYFRRDVDEIDEDLMDLIDPDMDNAVPILRLANRLLYVALDWSDNIRSEADYERALLRSVAVASSEGGIVAI